MELIFKNKQTVENILDYTKTGKLVLVNSWGNSKKNKLIKGENLSVMKSLLKEHDMVNKIDLVYIDPPFSTNNIFKHNEKRSSTISSSKKDNIAYSDTITGEDFLGFIRERLILIRELMSNHSSIYLHIDYKIGHYVKVIMDEIFGQKNFRNDITRIKCNPKNFSRKGYGNIKDLILFYTKSNDFIWNEPKQKVSEKDINRLFAKIDNKGQKYTTTPLHAPGETTNGRTGKMWKGLLPPKGRHWRYDPSVLDELESKGLIEWSQNGNPRKIIYADVAREKGKRMQDIWEYKDLQYPSYPTEKNLDLLKTIITTSSNINNMVFDCFCGSGTTLLAANQLKRNWIGIDNSQIAIQSTIKKLSPEIGLFNTGAEYEYLEERKSTKLVPIKV